MHKINFHFLFPVGGLILLIIIFSNSFFSIPPVGKLLNPFTGIIQNNNTERFTELNQAGVSDSVQVYFDTRKVPHIYAKNTKDLFFAQGYVTASLRLWQMDFVTYVSAGRLSEIFEGDTYVDYDRNQRRIGIVEAAKKSLAFIEKDKETLNILNEYTRGVNAYIKQLSDKTIPFEYKLLDYYPEPWSNLKSLLIMKQLGNTLSGFDEDMFMSENMLALGEEKFNRFFPEFPDHFIPVMDIKNGKNNQKTIKKPYYLNYSFLTSNEVISKSKYNPKLGSNSWAVSGKLTKSGFPILCSDPHLGLTLPSIWIEMQLNCPGMNVYGVSIPGTPAVIIGFNENIAWGITNGADDVKDWYKLKISSDYKKYQYDGKWLALKSRTEIIKRKKQQAIQDTVYTTVHGPVVISRDFLGDSPELKDYALKWELNNASNEFHTFIELGKAKNYKDYKAAIKDYSSPILNFSFAGKDNTIAIDHQGKMALKPAGGGKFLLDGSRSDQLYTSYIPNDSLPHLVNPACNYVLSANQHPTYQNYKYYYNGYYSETRANRIKELLESKKQFDVHTMMQMQLDNVNVFAREAIPVLIEKIDILKLNGFQKKELQALRSWKGTYDINDLSAEFFELWWKEIKDNSFTELKKFKFSIRHPDDNVLLKYMMEDPGNDVFDNQETSRKESASDMITTAFIRAYAEAGTAKKQSSKWGDINRVNIMHMTNIPAFSRTAIPSGGHPQAINAISKNWGPSWRMIVQLGERPQGYGIYPGGQSGDMASLHYDDFVNDWARGKYYKLNFYMSVAEAKKLSDKCWVIK